MISISKSIGKPTGVQLGAYLNHNKVLRDGNTVAWYDTSDATTITMDAQTNEVSLLKDKLGSGHDLKSSLTNRPIWVAPDMLVFDGVNDGMQTDPFPYVQPEFAFIVCKIVAYQTANTYLFDGLNTSSGGIICTLGTKALRAYAGAFSEYNIYQTIGEFCILRVLFNGIESKLMINDTVPFIGNLGTANMGGITIGHAGSYNGDYSNIAIKEAIYRKAVPSESEERVLYNYLADKYTVVGARPNYLSMPVYKESFNKLLAGEQTIYNINVIGDSITAGAAAGVNNDDYYNLGYLGRIRSKYDLLFDDTGYGFMPVFHQAPQPKWTLTGTWEDYTLMGVGQLCKSTTEIGATATVVFNGTGISLMTYGETTRGTISIAIDGGVPIIRDLAYESNLFKFEEIAGLIDGAHTCVITNLEAIQFELLGAYEIKGSSGFRVNLCGRAGVRSTELTANTNTLTNEIDMWSPVLTIIASITNDIGGSLDINTYKANLHTLVTRAKLYGDVILLANNARVDISDAIQSTYVNAMSEVAANNACNFVNIYKLWDRKAIQMNYMVDTLHPNAAGHQSIADVLYQLLK